MRPERLRIAATRVVKAMPEAVLPWTLKGLWLEHHALHHRPEGCFASATVMAQRTGLSPHTVERHRRILAAIGLLLKDDAPRGAIAGWIPTLPESCIPDTDRLTPWQLEEYARRLAAHLEKWQPTIHRTDEAERPNGRHLRRQEAATGNDTPAASGPPLPAQTSQGTGSHEAGGMEMLEEVGEKPPASPPPLEDGGFADKTNNRLEPVHIRDVIRSPVGPSGAVSRCESCGRTLGTTERGRFVPCPCYGETKNYKKRAT